MSAFRGFILCFSLFFSFSLLAQKDEKKDTVVTVGKTKVIAKKIKKSVDRSPAKAAFYSAILPGLGQAYNRSYWKIPIVYGALGTSIFFAIDNSNEFNRFRNAFRRRLAGFNDDEFFDINGDGSGPDVSDQALQDAQESLQRNRELAIIITVGLYILNIIEANVDANLKKFNVSDDLSLKPYLEINEIDYRINAGLSLKFNF